MVKVYKFLAIFAAGSAVANTSSHSRRGQQSANAAQIKQAVNLYAELLTGLTENIGASGAFPGDADVQTALNTFVTMMDTVKQLQVPAAGNSTSWAPNWEGALIGALVSSQFGALAGGLLGANTNWTFSGFQTGLSNFFGGAAKATGGLLGGSLPGGLPKGRQPPAGLAQV